MNWCCYTMVISVGFSSKLLASMVGCLTAEYSSDYIATRISLSPFFLCCSSSSCRDREFTSSCFVCRDINNLCHDRDFVALSFEF